MKRTITYSTGPVQILVICSFAHFPACHGRLQGSIDSFERVLQVFAAEERWLQDAQHVCFASRAFYAMRV